MNNLRMQIGGQRTSRRLQPEDIVITEAHTFGTVFSDPRRCQRLIELILDIELDDVLSIEIEHVEEVERLDYGVRLDVWVRDKLGELYYVELRMEDQGVLPWRPRFNLAVGNRERIAAGTRYYSFKGAYVISICTFDPFGLDLSRYTYRPICEESGKRLEDGVVQVFLNALAGEEGERGSLAAFLRYVCGDKDEGDPFVREVDGEVRRLRDNATWREDRLTLDEYLIRERMAEHFKGRQEGLEAGLEKGREEGERIELYRLIALMQVQGIGAVERLLHEELGE